MLDPRGAPIADPPGDREDAEARKRIFLVLQRYAGWLAKDHASVRVRADVQALGTAIDTAADTSALLQALDADIGRLPSGGIRKMLRIALGDIRTAIKVADR